MSSRRSNSVLSLNACSSLGEIVRVWQVNKRKHVSIHDHCDDLFGSRPDYMCWRYFSAVNNRQLIPSLGLRDAGECYSYALDEGGKALNDESAIIRWGGISSITSAFCRPSIIRYLRSDSTRLIPFAELVAVRSEERLAGAQSACAFLELMARHNLLRFNYKLRRSTANLQAAKEYVERVEFLVQGIDPSWRAGQSFNLDSIRQEDSILSFGGMTDVAYQIGHALFVSSCVPFSVATHDDAIAADFSERLRELLLRAALHARSAWLTHRSERKALAPYRRNSRITPRKAGLIAEALDRELQSLFRYSQALSAGGDYVNAARVSWMVAHVIQRITLRNSTGPKPEMSWFLGADKYGLRRAVDDKLKQVGMTRPYTKQPERDRIPIEVSGSVEVGADERPIEDWDCIPKLNRHVSPNDGELIRDLDGPVDPLQRLIQFEFETDPLWNPIRSDVGSSVVGNPLELITKVKDNWSRFCSPNDPSSTKPPSQEVLRSAYYLALRHSRLDEACYFLKRTSNATGYPNDTEYHGWWIAPEDLVSFSEEVCKATAILPIAIDYDTHYFWRERLTRVWSVVTLTVEQELILHESVHGCCTTLCSRRPFGEELLRRYADEDDVDVDRSDKALGVRWTPTNSGRLKYTIQLYTETTGQAIVAVSVAALRDKGFSIWGLGTEGNLACQRIDSIQLEQLENELKDELDYTFDSGDFNTGFSGGYIKDFCKILGDFVDLLGPNVDLVLLAVDPELASVPWNLLFRDLKRSAQVSVVPSLGWIERRLPRKTEKMEYIISPRNKLIENRTNEEIEKLDSFLDQVYGDRLQSQPTWGGAAFVVGHGCTLGGAVTKFLTAEGDDGPIDIDRWCQLAAKHETLIVHACMTGLVEEKFIGDFSGVPGVALMTGARLVICPIVDINVSTAAVLHRHLTDPARSDSVVSRYRTACDECECVGLYNMYGFLA